MRLSGCFNVALMKRMFDPFWKQEKSLKYTRMIHHIPVVSFWVGWKGGRYMLLQQTISLDNETIVITVYEPGQDKWSPNFKRRIP